MGWVWITGWGIEHQTKATITQLKSRLQTILKLILIQMIKCSGQRHTLIYCLQRRPSIVQRRKICCHNLFRRRNICCHSLFFQKKNRYLNSQHIYCLNSFFEDTNLPNGRKYQQQMAKMVKVVLCSFRKFLREGCKKGPFSRPLLLGTPSGEEEGGGGLNSRAK